MNELVNIYKHDIYKYLYAINFNRIPDINIYIDMQGIMKLNDFITFGEVNYGIFLMLREYDPVEVNSILPKKELYYRIIVLHIDEYHKLKGSIQYTEFDKRETGPLNLEFDLEDCEVLELVNKLIDICDNY